MSERRKATNLEQGQVVEINIKWKSRTWNKRISLELKKLS